LMIVMTASFFLPGKASPQSFVAICSVLLPVKTGMKEDETSWVPFKGEDDPLPTQVSPFATSSVPTIECLFSMLDEIQPTDSVLDLGCGDGRIVKYAAMKHGLCGYGIDVNQELIQEARKAALEAGIDHLVCYDTRSFLDEEFDFSFPWNTPPGAWNGPTIITSYLTPKALRLLEPKLLAYAQRAAAHAVNVRVLTVVFSFNNWIPLKVSSMLNVHMYDLLQQLHQDNRNKHHKAIDGYHPAF